MYNMPSNSNMKRTHRGSAELEAELLRLNTLVRERRKQLARLEECPRKDCECRLVWREVLEKKLATQVGKIRKQVRNKHRNPSRAKRSLRRPATHSP
jgi:hypothetical protein